MNWEEPVIATAIAAVEAACAATLAVRRGEVALRVHTKDDRSPVTVADFAAQAVVAKILSERLPSTSASPLTLVGEEDAAALDADPALLAQVTAVVRRVCPGAGAAQVRDWIHTGTGEPRPEGFWTLDPIDGTKGFVRGGQYAVCLAFIAAGEVQIGLLGCPSMALEGDPVRVVETGSLYVAARGAGAWGWFLGAPPQTARRLSIAPWRPDQPLRVAQGVETSHSNHEEQARRLAGQGLHPVPVALDSQAKYAVVASGRADTYFRIPNRPERRECIWDHASGTLIAAEAGCTVTDVRGRPLDYGRGRRLENNFGLLAAAPAAHPLLVTSAETPA